MAAKKSNSKSVRVSDEVLAYIENARGDGFNQKFENIILDAKRSEPERKRRLVEYDRLIEQRKQQLSKITEKIQLLDIEIQAIFSLQDEVHHIQKQLAKILAD